MTHKARKRFGQNFLHDHRIIANIINHLQIKKAQHWVEIGPGQGALTAPLLAAPIDLDVIELDRDLVALLEKKFAQSAHLTIHSADALTFDFAALAKPAEKLHIIGNLPYNISTPLLFHLLRFSEQIADMHFMLQKEVVDRICAAPDSKKYGRLSVMMQYYCEAESLFDVPPESFEPMPQVTSAIIRLTPHSQPPVKVASVAILNKIVTAAFSQRRKTLRNSLKNMITEAQMMELGINPTARAETLTLEEFAQLTHLWQNDVGFPCDNLPQ
jgi:16S rRNA (adenine1518-N6/adenine1519-N6)-dimethyltransferase